MYCKRGSGQFHHGKVRRGFIKSCKFCCFSFQTPCHPLPQHHLKFPSTHWMLCFPWLTPAICLVRRQGKEKHLGWGSSMPCDCIYVTDTNVCIFSELLLQEEVCAEERLNLLAQESVVQPWALSLGARISEAAPAEAKRWGSCVWTLWPGVYIPQDFSITGLGRGERGHYYNNLLFSLNFPRGKESPTFFKTFYIVSYHLKWAVLPVWCRWHLEVEKGCTGLSLDLSFMTLASKWK